MLHLKKKKHKSKTFCVKHYFSLSLNAHNKKVFTHHNSESVFQTLLLYYILLKVKRLFFVLMFTSSGQSIFLKNNSREYCEHD